MKTRHTILFITILLLSFNGLAQKGIVKVSSPNRPVQYEKAEWDIAISAAYSNPYDSADIVLDMLLTAPSGRKIILPCYFNNGNTGSSFWKARFAPQETGTYTYQFKLVANGIESISKQNKFSASASDKLGFLHLNNNWSLKFDSGKPFRGIGENVDWEGRDFEDPKYAYEYFLPTLAKNKGSFFRTLSTNWNIPVEWQTVETKKRPNKRYRNSTTWFHPQGTERLDKLVELSDSLGLHMMLTFNYHGDLKPSENWSINPYNAINGGPAKTPTEFFSLEASKKRYRNRLRYIVARWGYSTSIGMWELFNEVDNAAYSKTMDAGGDASKDSIVIPHALIASWHNEMAGYLKKIDPYHHIVTTSISHRNIKGLFDAGSLDINQEHIYKKTDSIPSIIRAMQKHYRKPVVIGEYAFRWEDANAKYTAEYNYDYKKGLWYGLFSPTPVLPMTWWWEFMDKQGNMQYLQAVQIINEKMLEAGKGSFEVVDAKANGMVSYAVKCGSTFFVYILNNGDATNAGDIVLNEKTLQGNYAVQQFQPSNMQFEKKPQAIADKQNLSINNISLAAKEQLILIIEKQD